MLLRELRQYTLAGGGTKSRTQVRVREEFRHTRDQVVDIIGIEEQARFPLDHGIPQAMDPRNDRRDPAHAASMTTVPKPSRLLGRHRTSEAAM